MPSTQIKDVPQGTHAVLVRRTAPHLLDAEVGSALHRLTLSQALPHQRARSALLPFAVSLPITRVPHGHLRARASSLVPLAVLDLANRPVDNVPHDAAGFGKVGA